MGHAIAHGVHQSPRDFRMVRRKLGVANLYVMRRLTEDFKIPNNGVLRLFIVKKSQFGHILHIAMNAVNLFPNRFAAVILCDTQCISDTAEVKAGRNKTIDLIKSGGKKEFADGFIKKLFYASTFETKPELVNEIQQTILSTDDASIIGTYGIKYQTEIAKPELDNFKTDIENILLQNENLIIAGDLNTSFFENEKRHLPQIQSRSELINFTNTHHIHRTTENINHCIDHIFLSEKMNAAATISTDIFFSNQELKDDPHKGIIITLH